MIISLTGPNTFTIRSYIKNLTDKFVKDHGDLSLERLDGDEHSADEMIQAAQALPFLAAKRIVILRNPSAQKQFTEQIEQIIKNVPDTTDLVIIEDKIDKRSVYYKALKTQTDYHEQNGLDSIGLSKWIVQYVDQKGGSITSVDAKYLLERAGQNQQLLANELDKLLLRNSQINRLNIDEMIQSSPQSTIFELLDAAFAGNTAKVLDIYKQQREMRVEPQQIIAMLAWQLHVLVLVVNASTSDANRIAKDAGISPYVVRKTQDIARSTSKADVKLLVSRALELDMRIKSESINADEALQHLLLTISK